MNSRERFLRVMRYEEVNRPPYFMGMGPWPETKQRWEKEGFKDMNSLPFNWDPCVWKEGWFFPNPPFERKVIEEDDSTILYINYEGILMRERKGTPLSSMPQFVKFPVETRDEFHEFWQGRMKPDLSARIGPDWKDQLTNLGSRDFPLFVIAGRSGGFFGPLRNLVGVEKLCTLFYDDPPFVEEMMDAMADFDIAMMDQILDCTDIEMFGFWEDMAYKSAPLISPEMVRRYMLPRYRRVVEFLRSRGVEFIWLDSDGDISSLIPVWLEAGINVLFPFEVQAGMDVVAVRRQYGRRLRIMYGIDKRALAKGPEAIEAELARVKPLMKEGGYVPGLDHSVPPDVPLENFCYYMCRLREVMDDV